MDNDSNEQTTLLKEILKWIKFAGLKEVKGILTNSLNNDPKRLVVYHLSDGNHGTIEIAAIAGIGNKTVLNLWKLWLRMGLGENIPVKGGLRFKRSFDLEEIGIELPEINATKTVKATPEAAVGQASGAENTEGSHV